MIYNFSNASVLINGDDIIADSVSLSASNDIEPVYLESQRSTKKYSSESNSIVMVSLSYHITGRDPLSYYLDNEGSPISGNFGGLYFDSGYLSSYSFNGDENSELKINAEIIAFEKLKGKFSPTYRQPLKKTALSTADIILSNISGEFCSQIINPIKFSYNYKSNIAPFYSDTYYNDELDLVPSRVSFEEKSIDFNFVCDDLSGYIPIGGGNFRANIRFSHPTQQINQSYLIDGKLHKKTFSFSLDQPILNEILIKQDSVGLLPFISGFTVSGVYGDTILITGANLSNSNEIVFYDVPTTDFEVIGDDLISVVVPNMAIDGPITVKNPNGIYTSFNDFYITPEQLSITSFSPIIQTIGEYVNIFGDNFYRISHVLFSGSESSDFLVVNESTINVIVPDDAQWGPIDVVSLSRGVSGHYDLEYFVPTPEISDFNPKTGVFGSEITITGKALQQIWKVTFNNLEGNIVQTNPLSLVIEVPDGNTYGDLKIFGQSGTSDIANFNFIPVVTIEGVIESSGYPNDVVYITGQNFRDSLLFEDSLNTGHYIVDFNGSTGIFKWLSHELMSGLVPENDGGLVKIMNNQGSFYSSDVIWTKNEPYPVINDFFPFSGEINQSIYLYGSGLKDVIYINMSGKNNDGEDIGFLLDSSDLSESYNGEILSLVIPVEVQTGFYQFFVQTVVGSGSSHTGELFYVNPEVIEGSIGPSGFPGSQFTGNFGLYISPSGVNTIKVYNESHYGMTIILPGIGDFIWQTAQETQSVPFYIAPRSSGDLSLSIINSSVFAADHFDITGTWTSEDEYSGSFVAFGALGS